MGGWAQFNDRMGEAKEALGTAILPLLSSAAGFLNDTIAPAVETVAAAFAAWLGNPATQSGISTLTSTISGGLSTALAYLSNLWTTSLQPALATAWAFIQAKIMPIFADLGTAVMPLVGAALQVLAGLWQDVLLPALRMLGTFLSTVVVPILATVASWLATYLPPAIQFVADFLTNTLFPALHTIYDFISTYVIPIIATVVEWFLTQYLSNKDVHPLAQLQARPP